jgi:hypothetical protein
MGIAINIPTTMNRTSDKAIIKTSALIRNRIDLEFKKGKNSNIINFASAKIDF